MNEQNEKPIILVIVTFFLAMTLVYIAFFRTQPWLGLDTNTTTLNEDTNSLMSWLLAGANSGTLDLSGTLDQWIDLSSSWSTNLDTTWTVISNNVTTTSSWPVWKNKLTTLPWIKPRYGSIGMAELLWLTVKEAFVDTWSIQYGYLGTGSLDTLASTVRRLWWNVLAIETENDINKNLLRWDRILFINIPRVTFVSLPTEQKLLVAMVIIIDNDKWIIEAKIDRYYAAKPFMKKVFEQLYSKKL